MKIQIRKFLVAIMFVVLPFLCAANEPFANQNLEESSGLVVALDSTLMLYGADSEQVPMGTVFRPSSHWKSGSEPLVKLHNRRPGPVERHTGLDPNYRLYDIRLQCDQRAGGLLMEGVTGSWFFGIQITDCIGTAVSLVRCGENDFHSLCVTNCSADPKHQKDPLVNLSWGSSSMPISHVGGNNNNRFFGGRFVSNKHSVYLLVDSPDFAGPCRNNQWFGCQFHVPPPRPFPGQPTDDHIAIDPDRVMVVLGKKSSSNTFTGCNFTTRMNEATIDTGRSNTFVNCTYMNADSGSLD